MEKAFPDFRCGKEFDGTQRNPGRDRDKRCFFLRRMSRPGILILEEWKNDRKEVFLLLRRQKN